MPSLLDIRLHHDLTHDELINTLIQAEWEDREHKKVTRHLRLARFRYAASIEELNFVSRRGLDKTQVFRPEVVYRVRFRARTISRPRRQTDRYGAGIFPKASGNCHVYLPCRIMYPG